MPTGSNRVPPNRTSVRIPHGRGRVKETQRKQEEQEEEDEDEEEGEEDEKKTEKKDKEKSERKVVRGKGGASVRKKQEK